MGGADKLARQQKKGRLHARARIEKLLDAGSRRIRPAAVSRSAGHGGQTPADGKVCGWGAIEQRRRVRFGRRRHRAGRRRRTHPVSASN